MKQKIRPRCLKATPASEYVGISRRYLTQLSQDGKIPYSKIGTRTYLYDIVDLDNFVESRKVGKSANITDLDRFLDSRMVGGGR